MKAFFAVIFGLIGLLMSSCGLLFMGMGGGGVAVIALPSIAIGALLIWAAVALWKSWRARNPDVKL